MDAAVSAATAAFPAWSGLTKEERAKFMYKVADLIEDRAVRRFFSNLSDEWLKAYQEELIAAESRDNGKPRGTARMVDIPRAAANFRYLFLLLSCVYL